ncbi:helix-turn-helix transcriptional regulator [Lysobacter korlensis]|uniref:Helix-turn-helix transcriptional regulator n=1 Tax=Lysobacter korlensis TaxID=553636 RepID=A0ABV6RT11_9GAMM
MMFAPGALRPSSTVNISSYSPGARFGPRRMTDYELVWMLTGSARWTVRRPSATMGAAEEHLASVRLEPGTVALGIRGTDELYEWDAVHGASHAWVHFEVDPAAERAILDRLVGSDVPPVRELARAEPLGALTDYLLALARAGSDEGRRRSDEMVALFVDLLLSGPVPGPAPASMSPLIAAALDFVRQAWRNDGHRILSLAEIAEAAGVSSAHLSREFSKSFGVGLIHALELVRLGRAAIALQRSNLNVEEVSREAGFVSPFYFSRRFSAAYGQPPGRYRNLRAGAGDPLSPLTTAGLMPVWQLLTR